MDINKYVEEELVVLSERSFQETSKIITAYGKSLGRISLLIKGGKRSTHALMGLTQPFTHGTCRIIKRGNFFYMSGGKVIDSNVGLRSSFEQMISASFMVELLERTSYEGEGNEKVFLLLVHSLRALSSGTHTMDVLIGFLIKFVTFAGYRPDLQEGGNTASFPETSLPYLRSYLYAPIGQAEVPEEAERRDLFSLLITYTRQKLEIETLYSLELI